MPHAAINGQQIYFEDTGGEGPAVILGHGFLMDHEMFVHQVAAPVSYTHLRAHETVLDLVCRLLLETKNTEILTHTRSCA